VHVAVVPHGARIADFVWPIVVAVAANGESDVPETIHAAADDPRCLSAVDCGDSRPPSLQSVRREHHHFAVIRLQRDIPRELILVAERGERQHRAGLRGRGDREKSDCG
jgi:hypothetical protein